MAQRQSSFAKVQNGAVEDKESGEEEEEEVVFTASVENPFGILPNEDGGDDVEDFLETVAVVAKKGEEEEKKQREKQKEQAKKVQQQQQQQQQFLRTSARAKRPIVPKWNYRSQVVFMKPQQEDQEQEHDGIDQEQIKNAPGGKGVANNIDRRRNSVDNSFRGRRREANGEGYRYQKIINHQQKGNYQGKYSRNYQYNNGEERRNHGHGYYLRNYNRSDYRDNHGYRERYIGETGYDQQKNYRGGNYLDQRNNDQGYNDGDYQISNREKGGKGQQWRLRTRNMSLGDHDGSDQNQENENTAVVQGVPADDASEKKGLDAVKHSDKESSSVPENAEGAKKTENSENKKMKKKKDSDKKPQEEQRKEPESTMTYLEYQKVLLEKKKALEARLNAENFEPMQPIKGDKVGSSKTKSEQDVGKKEGAAEKKVSNSVSINEFLKPAEGTTSRTTSFNGHNGLAAGERSNAGHGYQGNYRPNYGRGGNVRGYHQDQGERTGSGRGGRRRRRGFSGPLPARTRPENMFMYPDFEDIIQFPALGEAPK